MKINNDTAAPAPVNTDLFVCVDCGKELDEYNTVYAAGEEFCSECYEYYLQDAPTLYHLKPGYGEDTNDRLYYLSGYGFDDECNESPVEPLGWISDGGWRGRFGYKPIEGWTMISGWTTGWTDSTTRGKDKLNEIMALIMAGKAPIHIWLMVSRTSNVFSSTIDLFVKDSNMDTFDTWLAENGCEDGLETLDHLLH